MSVGIKKQRSPYTICLPNGERFIKHYYSLAQADGHAKQLCIQKGLDIRGIVIHIPNSNPDIDLNHLLDY